MPLCFSVATGFSIILRQQNGERDGIGAIGDPKMWKIGRKEGGAAPSVPARQTRRMQFSADGEERKEGRKRVSDAANQSHDNICFRSSRIAAKAQLLLPSSRK